MSRPCVWLHDAAISPEDVALRSHSDAVVIFVFDTVELHSEPVAFHRLSFMYEAICAVYREIPHVVKEVRVGDPVEEILACCTEHGCDTLALTDHPDPATQYVIEQLRTKLTVQLYPRDELTDYDAEPRRFSPYWKKASAQILGYRSHRDRKHHQ